MSFEKPKEKPEAVKKPVMPSPEVLNDDHLYSDLGLSNNPQKEEASCEKHLLLPEDMARTMEKIQDINQVGTAFHVFNYERDTQNTFESIFQHGLLSKSKLEPLKQKDKPSSGNVYFFFNIIGRSFTDQKENIKISHSVNSIYSRKAQFTVIFDISKMTEVASSDRGYRRHDPIPNLEPATPKTYWAEWWVPSVMNNGAPVTGVYTGPDQSYELWKRAFGDLLPGDPRILEGRKNSFEAAKQ